MRKGLKLVATVLIVAVVALLAIVALAPIMIESRKDDLLGLASRAVGEPITAETLELALLPPGIRVGGLGIGSPALVSAGEVAVDFELLAFLRKGRLHLSVEATDLTLDLARETTKSDESDSSASAFELPMPVEATVLIENLRVGLSEDRQVTARRLGGELAAKLSGDATLRLDGESLELIGRRQTRLDTLHAEARFVDGTVLIVERFDVGGPDLVIKGKAASASSAAAQQLVFAPVDIEAAGELGPVLEFFAGETGIEGQASIAIELSGALADPEVEGDVRLEAADLGGFPVDSLAARARRLPGGLWKAGDLVLERPEGRYTGSLTIDENSLALSAQLSWTGIDLAAIVDSSATWRPTSSGAATLSIDLDHFRLVASGGGSLENRGRAVPFNGSLRDRRLCLQRDRRPGPERQQPSPRPNRSRRPGKSYREGRAARRIDRGKCRDARLRGMATVERRHRSGRVSQRYDRSPRGQRHSFELGPAPGRRQHRRAAAARRYLRRRADRARSGATDGRRFGICESGGSR